MLLAISPATDAAAPVSRARYLMGTVCEGVALPPHPEGTDSEAEAAAALEAAFDEIARLERVLSDYRDDSELSRLNREGQAAPFRCTTDLFDLLQAAAGFSRDTQGAFDMTVGPLVAAWDLRGRGRVPDPAALASAREATGWDKLLLDSASGTVRFRVPGMRLDPGGIGKGYALDAAAGVLKRRGITRALLDFGGQILALGAPDGATAWEASIAHPLRRDLSAMSMALRDASISTSGNAEKGLVVEGRRLGHILDPRTGMPLATTASVSVVAPTAVEADALSTALLVMGPEAGLRWAATRPDLSVVFLEVNPDGELRIRSSANSRHIAPPGPAPDGVNSSRRNR
ncbi:MAG TPA: FAD:protein FMN transferase [Candidatus Polarisedimenticolia bacterium]|nr:FAD:protein FMN transferase [Candidatus Polarisedimenticolia bacterium]